MDLQLAGRTVLVTGASGGIGRALCEAFAAEGAQLACHAFRQKDALAAWLAGRPWRERALVVQGDVRDPAAMERVFAEARARFGRVDICVANAGARAPAAARLHEADPATVRGVVETNLLGSLWTARAFLASLPAAPVEGACLLLVGSTAAAFGERGFADYAAAKSGLYGLLRTLKNEIVALDPRGRVNLIEPGWTATHVPRKELEDPARVAQATATMPLRRIGTADDVAQAALWLASPRAAHVTGQILTVAGGMEGRVLWPTS